MTVNVRWDQDCAGVVRFDLSGDWTWLDLQTAWQQAKALAAGVAYPLAIIAYISGSVPPAAESITALNWLLNTLARHQARGMIVGLDVHTQATVQALAKVTLRSECEQQFVETLEEARALIAAYH
jgi:hypothetical protein